MSDTPETDAAALASDWGWSLVLKETCRRLERERDKAEAGWSECREFAQRVVDERDDAREARNECERQYQAKVEEVIRLMCERDQWRIQSEQAEMALQDIARGTSCRECGGEDQARLAKDVIKTASNL